MDIIKAHKFLSGTISPSDKKEFETWLKSSKQNEDEFARLQTFWNDLGGAYSVPEADVEKAFSEFGKVNSVKIIKDIFTQESRGFGFVEMPSNTEAQTAIEKLNTFELKGKRLIVNEARPPRKKRGGPNRGGGGGGRRR